jgi:hypothetical protein
MNGGIYQWCQGRGSGAEAVARGERGSVRGLRAAVCAWAACDPALEAKGQGMESEALLVRWEAINSCPDTQSQRGDRVLRAPPCCSLKC